MDVEADVRRGRLGTKQLPLRYWGPSWDRNVAEGEELRSNILRQPSGAHPPQARK
jgi:hypothetical protein